MTNKGDIEKLEYIKNQYHVMFNFTDYDEALDLAIKALEALEKCTYFGEGLCLKCTHYILNNCPFYEEADMRGVNNARDSK